MAGGGLRPTGDGCNLRFVAWTLIAYTHRILIDLAYT